MRRRIAVVLATVMATMALSLGASADNLGPCNDGNSGGIENATGANYAKHHIAFLAKSGNLGNGGHKPGTHRGFSACLGVHTP